MNLLQNDIIKLTINIQALNIPLQNILLECQHINSIKITKLLISNTLYLIIMSQLIYQILKFLLKKTLNL
jgi:hypothetical protein